MRASFMLLLAAVCFSGCAPTHTLKEVVNDPSLLMRPDPGGDNPIMALDQWMRQNMW